MVAERSALYSSKRIIDAEIFSSFVRMRGSRSHPQSHCRWRLSPRLRVARAEEVDKIVASVDGDPITMHDVRAFAESAGRTAARRAIPPRNQTFKEGLKGMIAQKLLAEEVAKYDDKIDEGQIDKLHRGGRAGTKHHAISNSNNR